MEKDKKPTIQSLERALDILEIVEKEEGLHSKEIAERAGLMVNTANNMLRTLFRRAYLMQDESGGYFLGGRIWQLSASQGWLASLRMMTQPVLSQLARDTGDNSFIGIEQGGRLIIAAHALGDGVIRVAERQKWQEQFHCTGAGKVFLVERGSDWLKTVLKGEKPEKLTDKTITAWKELESEISLSGKRGFVACEDESSVGISSIGVPVKDEAGKLLCALSQSFPTYFLKEKTIVLKDRAVMLQRAAEKIAAAVAVCGAENS